MTISAETVIEIVPNWLNLLLTKYGLREGRLIGIEAPPPPKPKESKVDTGMLSNLLEQMAEDGPTVPDADQFGSSVEWGPATAAPQTPPPGPIDDLLESFDSGPDDYTQPPSQSFDQPASQSEDDVPDWLMDALDAPMSETVPPTDEAASSAPASSASDIPDWLTDALDTPDSQDTPDVLDTPSSGLPTSVPIQPDAEPQSDLDWLATPASETEPSGEDQDLEIPDWLSQIPPETPDLPPPSQEEAPPEPEQASPQAEWPVPDWLDETDPEPAVTKPPPSPKAKLPTTAELTSTIKNLIPSDDTPPAATPPPIEPDEPQSDIDDQPEVELPQWLQDGADEAEEPSVDQPALPDWLAAEPSTTEPLPAAPAETEVEDDPAKPDWLAPDPASVVDQADPPDEAQEMDDWLADLRPTGAAESDLPEPEPELPDWLAADAPSAADAEPAAMVESQPTDEGEAPSWLDDLRQTDEPVAEPPAAETPPTPTEPEPAVTTDEADWLASLPKVPDTDDLEPTAAVVEADTEAPGWLDELRLGDEPAAEQAGAEPPAGEAAAPLTEPALLEDDPDLPSWLTAEPEPAAESQPAAQDDTPNWLDDLRPTDEPAAEQAGAEAAPAPIEPEPAITDSEPEMPDWLAAEPADDDEDTPSWLADLQQVDEAAVTETADDDDTPSWLADLRQADEPEAEAPVAEVEPTPTAPEPAVAETANDEDTPSWLADLHQAGEPEVEAHVVEVEPTPTAPEPAITEDEPDTPSWLADLPEVPDTNELERAPAAESQPADGEDTPSWLADLRQADEPEVEAPVVEVEPTPTAPEPAVTETADDEDTPSWLADLHQADEPTAEPPAVEAISSLTEPESVVAETDDDEDTPSWLADLRQVDEPEVEAPVDEPEPAITEDEPDTPSWLADLRQADEPEVEAPVVEVEPTPTEPEPAVTETADDEDTPSWLADLHQADEPEVEAPVDEPDTPSWLADLRQADEPEVEAPVVEVEPTPTEPEPAVTETADDEDAPSWLADLRQADEPEAEALVVEVEPTPTEPEPAAAEDEPDAPDWLADLAEVPDTNDLESAPAAESQPAVDAPDWLADLRQADKPAAEAPVVEVEPSPTEPEPAIAEDDEVTPSWLADVGQADEESAAESPAVASVSSLTEPEPAAAETDDADDTPSWLADLRQADEPGAEPPVVEIDPTPTAPEPVVPDNEPDAPDWLADLPEVPGSADFDEPAAVAAPARPEEDDPTRPTAVAAGLPASPEETDTPDWLADLPGSPEADEGERATAIVESDTDEQGAAPGWLADLQQAGDSAVSAVDTIEPAPAEAEPDSVVEPSSAETEPDAPDWLSGLRQADAEAPPESAEPADRFGEVTQVPHTPSRLGATPVASTGQETPDLPDWLSDLRSPEQAEPELPGWLVDEVQTGPDPGPEADQTKDEPETEGDDDSDPFDGGAPPAPDWMAGLADATAAVQATLPPEVAEPPVADETVDDRPPPDIPEPDEPDEPQAGASAPKMSAPTDAPPVEAGIETQLSLPPTAQTDLPEHEQEPTASKAPGWLDALNSTAASDAEDEGLPAVAESTGVMTGLTGLLPTERLSTPEADGATLADQPDALQAAARQFQTIATQVPKPISLPKPLFRYPRFTSNLSRGGVYLAFLLLILLPLLPGLRAADTERGAPWSEPGGELSEVLGRQRRQMVSEELGIIDFQQPEAVALVSFDFNTATQGEMQPITEAIVGRLLGQGMRLIFISLNPEGAALAEGMVDKIIADRGEVYGLDVVNLGYIPGQMAGVRRLTTGETTLAELPDFRQGQFLSSDDFSAWNGIDSLDQVNLIVTLADTPATARWWIEQLALVSPPEGSERPLLAGTSATAAPFLQPYRQSGQLDGLIAGVNGAAAVEAGRREVGPARQMLDSLSLAHLLIVVLMAAGTIVGWMPPLNQTEPDVGETDQETDNRG